MGCGKGESDVGLKEGDKFEVAENLDRLEFLVRYGTTTKNNVDKAVLDIRDEQRGNADIPAGTIFSVFENQKAGTNFVEVVPVKATVTDENGQAKEVTDSEELRALFIPSRYLKVTYEDEEKGIRLLYYTFVISTKEDGQLSKLKKVD
jgi:hypothetical protein